MPLISSSFQWNLESHCSWDSLSGFYSPSHWRWLRVLRSRWSKWWLGFPAHIWVVPTLFSLRLRALPFYRLLVCSFSALVVWSSSSHWFHQLTTHQDFSDFLNFYRLSSFLSDSVCLYYFSLLLPLILGSLYHDYCRTLSCQRQTSSWNLSFPLCQWLLNRLYRILRKSAWILCQKCYFPWPVLYIFSFLRNRVRHYCQRQTLKKLCQS